MAKSHFFPYIDNTEDLEFAPCGTRLGETGEITGIWDRVTCKRCMRRKHWINQAIEAEERAIVQQMGDMADFMSKQDIRSANP